MNILTPIYRLFVCKFVTKFAIFTKSSVLAVIILLMFSLSSIAKESCSSGKLTIKPGGNPHVKGYSCTSISSDLEIILKSGTFIETVGAKGLNLIGKGSVKIMPYNPSSSNTISTKGYGKHAIETTIEGDLNIRAGTVRTDGDRAAGILIVQKNPNGRASGAINVNVQNIFTKGKLSNGISIVTVDHKFSDNLPPTTTNINTNININLTGQLETKGESAHGIVVEAADADINIIVGPNGNIRVKKGSIKAFAIALAGYWGADFKSAVVKNMGTVSGSVLSEGCTQFFNYGTLFENPSFKLLYTDCPESKEHGLINFGNIYLGKINEIGALELTGDFYNKPGGKLFVDVDWEDKKSDKFNIIGNATLNGKIVVNNLALPLFSREVYKQSNEFGRVVFLKARKILSWESTFNVRDTVLLDYSMFKKTSNSGETLELTLGLRLHELNNNQKETFWGMNGASKTFGDVKGSFIDILNDLDLSTVRYKLDSYGNEITGATMRATFIADYNFSKSAKRCTQYSAKQNIKHDDNCIIVYPYNNRFQYHSSNEQLGYNENQLGLDVSYVFGLDSYLDNVHLVLDYDTNKITMGNIANAKGDRTRIGFGIDHDIGKLRVEVSAHLSKSRYTIQRNIPVGDTIRRSKGQNKQSSNSIMAKFSYPLSNDFVEFRPYISAHRQNLKSNPYLESGAGEFSLDVSGSKNTITTLGGGIELALNEFDVGIVNIWTLLEFSKIVRQGTDFTTLSSFGVENSEFITTTRLPKSDNRIALKSILKVDKWNSEGLLNLGWTMGGGRQKGEVDLGLALNTKF